MSIDAGAAKLERKVSQMQANWAAFQSAATKSAYVEGLKRAGLSTVYDTIASNWEGGVKAPEALAAYKAKVTTGIGDRWKTKYVSKMTTGHK